MKSGSTRTLWIDLARTMAIILVALNHAVNRSYSVYSEQSKEYFSIPFASTIFKAVAIVVSHLGVPLFLMISGSLILKKSFQDKCEIRSFYKNNLFRLFITTEIWYFIMYWGIAIFFDRNVFGNFTRTIQGCIATLLFVNQKTMGCMWYMPMILCVYLVLPFFAIIVQKYSVHVFLLPGAVVYLCGMIVPFMNSMFLLSEREPISFALNYANIFSYYFLYIIAGYWISQGGLRKFKTRHLLTILCLLISGICTIQILAFKSAHDYVATYNCPFFLPIAICIFVLIKRYAHYIFGNERIGRFVMYLAKISFGIYFVHVCIMTFMEKFLPLNEWYRPVLCIFYLIVSLCASIIGIWLLSHIKFCKQYLFLIKDSTLKKPGLSA